MKTFIIKNKKIILNIISILLIYLLLLLGSILFNNELVFPRPNKIIVSFFKLIQKKESYIILFSTFKRLVISLSISFIIAFLLGILSGLLEDVEIILKPIINIFKSIPIIAIIIIIMSVSGFDLTPYLTTIFMTFPIIYQGIVEGVKNIKNEYLEAYKLDSNTNISVLSYIHLPLIKHNIYLSIIQSIGIGIKVLVVSEFIVNTKNSIGEALINEKNMMNYDNVFAYSIFLVIIISFIEYLTKKIKLNIKHDK